MLGGLGGAGGGLLGLDIWNQREDELGNPDLQRSKDCRVRRLNLGTPQTHRQLLQFKGLKFQLVWQGRGVGDSWWGGSEGCGLHPGDSFEGETEVRRSRERKGILEFSKTWVHEDEGK